MINLSLPENTKRMLAVIGVLGFMLIAAALRSALIKKYPTTIVAVPVVGARIYVNDKEITDTATSLPAGKQEIAVEWVESVRQTRIVNIKPKKNVFSFSLDKAAPPTGSKLSTQQQMEIEGLTTRLEEENLQKTNREERRILKILPISKNDFVIDYQPSRTRNPETDYAILIYAENPSTRISALDEIRSYGLDPSEFEIVFKKVLPNRWYFGNV